MEERERKVPLPVEGQHAKILFGVTLFLFIENKIFSVEGASSTSFKFPGAEIEKLAASGQFLGISIMPVVITSSVINGKKYYFVKQHQTVRPTRIQ